MTEDEKQAEFFAILEKLSTMTIEELDNMIAYMRINKGWSDGDEELARKLYGVANCDKVG